MWWWCSKVDCDDDSDGGGDINEGATVSGVDINSDGNNPACADDKQKVVCSKDTPSMLGKLNWFHLTALIILALLMWKWMGLFLKKNHLLRYWGCPSLHYLYC